MTHRTRENEMIEDRIASLLARPRTHRATITYACGKVRTYDAASESAAESFAHRERRKLGRDLIDRETGHTVRVVSVTVEAIA
jgi:hypothetical protein